MIPIHLPPLRERREDITPLAEHFVAKYREQMGKPVAGVTPEALQWLEHADWPGNVRQLENVIERAVALERGPLIQLSSLPSEQAPRALAKGPAPAADAAALPENGLDLPRHLETQERELVSQALRQSGGRHDKAAKLLAISPRQFRYLLDKYALR